MGCGDCVPFVRKPIAREVRFIAERMSRLQRRLNRSDPVCEAQLAALEAVFSLIRASRSDGSPPADATGIQRQELLREALGAARASVGAIGFALTQRSPTARSESANR